MFDYVVVLFEITKKRFVDVRKLLLFVKIFIVSDEEIRGEEFG
jgi:hypothetical protein